MEYLAIPFAYKTKQGKDEKVTFFIPSTFIESGDLQGWSLEPDNFLGVNLKMLLEDIKGKGRFL